MRSLGALALVLTVSACQCGPPVSKVNPSLGVAPAGLDFGQVKVGDSKVLTLRLEARTLTAVNLSSITLEGSGASAYRLGTKPTQLDPLGSGTLTVTFTPLSVAAFTGVLVLTSDDPDRPVTRVALAGEGAMPQLKLTLDCQLQARGCTSTVVQDPASIDFGAEPLVRLVPIDPTKLPTVVVVNEGAVPLVVKSASFRGMDAAAFSVAGNAMFPDGGVTLEAASGFNLPLRFVPTSEQQASYAAELVIASDDPDRPVVTVQLRGTLKPNQPPVVCANLVRVVPPTESLEQPREYGGTQNWAPLLTAPDAGYDFTVTRDVRPNELALFSALSDASEVTKCTSDPEDARMGLSWQWTLTGWPAGSQAPALSGATTSQAQLRPAATGLYTLELAVTDSRASTTRVTMRFAVSVKQDLVAQLEWPGAAGVDLDLHLVRPSAVDAGDPFSGAFAFFSAGPAGKTSGDVNGYAWEVRNTNVAAGFTFDWGQAGAADDPTLNVDERGTGPLVENISLNSPEHDPLCATSACTYRVMVHFFDDKRAFATPPTCVVDGGVGCRDGEQCGCATTERCVAASAPPGAVALGSGRCYPAPKPVVKLFFRGSPTAAAVLPLDTLVPSDELLLGAPCQLWHVADVAWPAASAIGSLPDGGTPPPQVIAVGVDGTGRITSPSIARFGQRPSGGNLKCEPDTTLSPGTVGWYSRRP
jgi:hypothetical protein